VHETSDIPRYENPVFWRNSCGQGLEEIWPPGGDILRPPGIRSERVERGRIESQSPRCCILLIRDPFETAYADNIRAMKIELGLVLLRFEDVQLRISEHGIRHPDPVGLDADPNIRDVRKSIGNRLDGGLYGVPHDAGAQ
jgi:hypothetical protein